MNIDTTEARRRHGATERAWRVPIAHKELNGVTGEVIGSAIDVHKAIGPGFTERIYAKALQHELRERDVDFAVEQPVRVQYKSFSRAKLEVKRVVL